MLTNNLPGKQCEQDKAGHHLRVALGAQSALFAKVIMFDLSERVATTDAAASKTWPSFLRRRRVVRYARFVVVA